MTSYDMPDMPQIQRLSLLDTRPALHKWQHDFAQLTSDPLLRLSAMGGKRKGKGRGKGTSDPTARCLIDHRCRVVSTFFWVNYKDLK